MINSEQKVLFITAAEFDSEDVEQLEPEDRSILTSHTIDLCVEKDFPDFDSVFFISENNCASLVSAHHMAELFEEEYKKHVRYMLLSASAWFNASKTLESVRAKDPFQEQLWIVVGSPQWVLRAANALLPLKDGIPYTRNISSAVVLCGYIYRKKELAYLKGSISAVSAIGLH